VIRSLFLAVVLALLSPMRTIAIAQDTQSRIDSILAPWKRSDGPGLAGLVVYRGRTVYAKGFGLSDIAAHTPIDRLTTFDLGSLTKQFTATAALILVRDGKLRLDAPLSAFYPEYAQAWSGITVRMLLNHTAGLPDFVALFRAKGAEFNDFPRESRGVTHVPEQDMKGVIQLIAQAPLRFAPRSSWAYCNSCYVVLAGVIERVTKQSYPEFLKAGILKPSGMTRSWVNTNPIPAIPPLARSYYPANGSWTERDYTPLDAVYGAGSLYASIQDLAHWCAAMDTGFVLPDSLASLERTSGVTTNGKPTHYGMGWVVDTSLGMARMAHGGWWKGFRHVVLRYPAEKLTVVLLSNDASFAPLRSETAFRIARLFLVTRMHLPVPARVSSRAFTQYSGAYRVDEQTEYQASIRDGKLWVNTGPATLQLEAMGNGQFFVAGVEEERFDFKRDGNNATLVRSEPGLGGTVRTITTAVRDSL
jgi:D-alanyl-D-alanine carboxypeptidase